MDIQPHRTANISFGMYTLGQYLDCPYFEGKEKKKITRIDEMKGVGRKLSKSHGPCALHEYVRVSQKDNLKLLMLTTLLGEQDFTQNCVKQAAVVFINLGPQRTCCIRRPILKYGKCFLFYHCIPVHLARVHTHKEKQC